MTPQQVTAIIIRLCAVFLFFQALFVIDLGAELGRITKDASVMTQVIFMIHLSLSVVCWFFPMQIAHYFIPNTKLQNTIQLQPYQAVFVTCVAMGLWVALIKGLPEVIRYITVAIIFLKDGQPITAVPATSNLRFLEGFIHFSLGILLVIKRSVISKKIIQLNNKEN